MVPSPQPTFDGTRAMARRLWLAVVAVLAQGVVVAWPEPLPNAGSVGAAGATVATLDAGVADSTGAAGAQEEEDDEVVVDAAHARRLQVKLAWRVSAPAEVPQECIAACPGARCVYDEVVELFGAFNATMQLGQLEDGPSVYLQLETMEQAMLDYYLGTAAVSCRYALTLGCVLRNSHVCTVATPEMQSLDPDLPEQADHVLESVPKDTDCLCVQCPNAAYAKARAETKSMFSFFAALTAKPSKSKKKQAKAVGYDTEVCPLFGAMDCMLPKPSCKEAVASMQQNFLTSSLVADLPGLKTACKKQGASTAAAAARPAQLPTAEVCVEEAISGAVAARASGLAVAASALMFLRG